MLSDLSTKLYPAGATSVGMQGVPICEEDLTSVRVSLSGVTTQTTLPPSF